MKFATIILFVVCGVLHAQKSPTFVQGDNPLPQGKKWKLIKNMSDEFKGKKIDESKWQISGQGWIGRAPGLFLANNVSVADGNLKIKTTKLPKPVIKRGKTFTHGGGYVGSWKGMTYGYYECRMKANKTFMSSTFWLINERSKEKSCDKRVIELDIQESIGQITTDKPFAQKMKNHMNSNTHSRGIKEGCDFEKGSLGAKQSLNENASDNYHIYGVWWKSKDEVLFYLDGKFHSKVTPPADFNLVMYLRMVVETYNWNPVPFDGGMNGSLEDRTTNYDWVRSWKLVNE